MTDFTPAYPALPGTPRSHLPFSPCVVSGPFVFVSGQASVDATGKIVPDTFEGEMRRSIENLARVLNAASCTLADVIQTRNYIDRPAGLAEYNRLYREYFKAPLPARTTITNCLGGTLKYEIECVAVKKSA
jgi:2-iminobutanoate/2-iminopropanoate deaminase